MSLLTVSAVTGNLKLATHFADLRKKALKENDSDYDDDTSGCDSDDSVGTARQMIGMFFGSRSKERVSTFKDAVGLAAKEGHWDVVEVLRKSNGDDKKLEPSRKILEWAVR
jgi:hypothetical protein